MFLRIISTGNISCADLGAKYASLKYADKLDKLFEKYRGFTCSASEDGNVWPKPDESSTTTSTGTSDLGGAGSSKTTSVSGGNNAKPTESSGAGPKKDDEDSGAAMLRYQYGYAVLALMVSIFCL